jgi:hypothetical protein
LRGKGGSGGLREGQGKEGRNEPKFVCRYEDNRKRKLTEFSQGNNVLDAPVSNTYGFLYRHACISSTS